jgi:epoxyqueuosine reductase
MDTIGDGILLMSSLSAQIIAKAESFSGVKAGFARLEDILKAPSYQAVPDGEWATTLSHEGTATEWPPNANFALILGLYHPEENPRLDWWDDGNTTGNRRLMEISDSLKKWLNDEHGLNALPLPYHVEWGGLFLKDAAVLAGLGVIGRSNLLLNPEWGPRIRFRSILIEGELEPTGPIESFFPCESCGDMCHSACPQNTFATGVYYRPNCIVQLEADVANKIPDGEVSEDGTQRLVIKYCRACEFVCPVGD